MPNIDLSSSVTIGEKEYIVRTESSLPGTPFIISRIILGENILAMIKADYSNLMELFGIEDRAQELMQRQHQMAMDILKKEDSPETCSPSDYIEGVKTLLMRKNLKNALDLLREALVKFPDNAWLLSYCGYLDAVVNRNHKTGINNCAKALARLKVSAPDDEGFCPSVLYLNLGRAYLCSGRKKNALATFKKGLEIDKDNIELLREVKRLGTRKQPPIPFLDRANPLNKYIGKLLHKLGK